MLYTAHAKHKEFTSIGKDKLPNWKINMTWSGKEEILNITNM